MLGAVEGRQKRPPDLVSEYRPLDSKCSRANKYAKRSFGIKTQYHLLFVAALIISISPQLCLSLTLARGALPDRDPAPGRSPGPPNLQNDGIYFSENKDTLILTADDDDPTANADESTTKGGLDNEVSLCDTNDETDVEVVSLELADSEVNLTVKHGIFESSELVLGVIYEVEIHVSGDVDTLEDYTLLSMMKGESRGEFKISRRPEDQICSTGDITASLASLRRTANLEKYMHSNRNKSTTQTMGAINSDFTRKELVASEIVNSPTRQELRNNSIVNRADGKLEINTSSNVKDIFLLDSSSKLPDLREIGVSPNKVFRDFFHGAFGSDTKLFHSDISNKEREGRRGRRSSFPFSRKSAEQSVSLRTSNEKHGEKSHTDSGKSVRGVFKKRRKIILQWTFADIRQIDAAMANITFRLRYRKIDSATIFQVLFTYLIRLDCILRLRNPQGYLTWTNLPYKINCKVFFPITTGRYGLVVDLQRLNVPCSTGGFLQFAQQGLNAQRSNKRLCGKLEELPGAERRFHYSTSSTKSDPYVVIHGSPVFSLLYKLVDFCYNITLTSRNGSFELEPSSSLDCTFRIHLPYGNRIALRLQMGESEVKTTETVNMSESATFVETRKVCEGMSIKLWDGVNVWHHCSEPGDPLKNVQIVSNENSITLSVSVQKSNRLNEIDMIRDSTGNYEENEYKYRQSISVIDNYKRDTFSIDKENVLLNVDKKLSNNASINIQTNIGRILMKREIGMSLKMWYHAESIEAIVGQCSYGWIAMEQFCISAMETRKLSWVHAEAECVENGGHLVSIANERAQIKIDQMLLKSPGLQEHSAYWVGASDREAEGDFRWTDGLPFSFAHWFPGWPQHGGHNRQPNDDGLSSQDCVELRRTFPALATATKDPHSVNFDSFTWNDRDCAADNYFVCERPLSDEPFEGTITPCNLTIVLTRDQPHTVVTSPGFPRQYPDDVICFSDVTAPPGFDIVVDFEELVVEREPLCSYDYLEIIEMDIQYQPYRAESHRNSSKEQFKANSWKGRTENGRSESHHSLDETNAMVIDEDTASRRLCGDWTSKLKLLRYVSNSSRLRLKFVSDYSHHYGGYKAKISMENAISCPDSRLRMFNGSCYLFSGYPQVTWYTAQQVCEGMGAHLTSIHSHEEETFVTAGIRNSIDYTAGSMYWIGSKTMQTNDSKNSFNLWSDGTKLVYKGWPTDDRTGVDNHDGPSCLAFQWRTSHVPTYPSAMFWTQQKCSHTGGYICKRKLMELKSKIYMNRTLEGGEGRLTSPNYPGEYEHNMDYYLKLKGPSSSRLVIQFSKIDIEYQRDCLYDYVEILSDDALKSNEASEELQPQSVRWCGTHDTDMTRFDFISSSSEALLHFHSDYSISGSGFSLFWQAVDMKGCPEQTFTAKEGVIKSPNYPFFLLSHLNCVFTILAPKGKRIWLEIFDLDLGSGRHKDGLPASSNDSFSFSDAVLEINLGEGVPSIRPFRTPDQLSDGAFVSIGEIMEIRLKTGSNPIGLGFKAHYKTVNHLNAERTVILGYPVSGGVVLHVNHPAPPPPLSDVTIRLVAPPANTLLLKMAGVTLSKGEDGEECGAGNGRIEVIDYYSDTNGTRWILCELQKNKSLDMWDVGVHFSISSYLNVIRVRQISFSKGVVLNASIQLEPDPDFKAKQLKASDDAEVDSCEPNPCLNEGRCVAADGKQFCQCNGHFTGMVCALTACDRGPCLFGACELTSSGHLCTCRPGYAGAACAVRARPCAQDPCAGRGACTERAGTFHCRCHAWWEGPRCERRMIRIPYKPLSERMLQEPFWLGLITVFVVLAIIGLVWCAKRHFPEKIEKLLAEEADRNNRYNTSLRCPGREMVVGGAAGTALAAAGSGATSAATGGGSQRSLFNRLGIRKPSLSAHSAAARTFSLDDLLKPPPRRTPSPRKKRNNSTPTKKNAAEKKHILQQLISPAAGQEHSRKVNMDDLIQMSQKRVRSVSETSATFGDSLDVDLKETSFINGEGSSSSTNSTRQINDSKLEKKVTFARLLNKVSAEMSSGSEMEIGILGITPANLVEMKSIKSCSNPPSPAVEVRSPHSTSSNQGSDSMSSLDVTIPNMSLRRYTGRANKISSADSILAMFRNFSSSTAGLTKPSSIVVSASTTPTASSPQDDVAGDDDSPTSSIHTPVSFSSGILDSPTKNRTHHNGNTIEVSVLDPLSACKSNLSGSNLLHPPTILLEIPSNINKCLSPIRELPTPLPSPAITPIMHRSRACSADYDEIGMDVSDDRISLDIPCDYLSHSEDDEEETNQDICGAIDSYEIPGSCSVILKPNSSAASLKLKLRPPPIGIDTPTPSTLLTDTPSPLTQSHDSERELSSSCGRTTASPRDFSPAPPSLVIPLLTIEQPSPTLPSLPLIIVHGSPPPQRASIGETSFAFPNRQQQRRLLKEFDKPTSLDLANAPPMITVTCNMSEIESDMEPISPGPNTQTLGAPGPSNMCYLSPFSMCTRGDRTTSESNLSSSGYSSMASPGPSRCGSSNPLCPSELDDPGSGSGSNLHPSLLHRRPSPLLKSNSNPSGGGSLKNNSSDQKNHCRGRSDSETLSDDPLIESNDEGIGTDHLEEKIEEGEIKSAKELALFISQDSEESIKSQINTSQISPKISEKAISTDRELDRLALPVISTKSTLRLPSIMIQADPTKSCEKLFSPVSSRSESPMSDKTGMGRFSPQFYSRNKEQLPFTDSDGLYDFPSSDCVHRNNSTNSIKISIGTSTQTQRKTTSRRRERKNSRLGLTGSMTLSPTKAHMPHSLQNLLDVPVKDSYFRTPAPRRLSPKRRSRSQHPVCSSSSSDSIHSARELTVRVSPDTKSSPSPDSVIWRSLEWTGSADRSEDATSLIQSRVAAVDESPKPHWKVNRLRTIGNQIRFLKRLEQSLKAKERFAVHSDDEGEESSSVTSPLLQGRETKVQIKKSQSTNKMQQPTSPKSSSRPRIVRQKKGVGAQEFLLQDQSTWRTSMASEDIDMSD